MRGSAHLLPLQMMGGEGWRESRLTTECLIKIFKIHFRWQIRSCDCYISPVPAAPQITNRCTFYDQAYMSDLHSQNDPQATDCTTQKLLDLHRLRIEQAQRLNTEQPRINHKFTTSSVPAIWAIHLQSAKSQAHLDFVKKNCYVGCGRPN